MNLWCVLNQGLLHKVLLSFVQLQPNPLISYLLYLDISRGGFKLLLPSRIPVSILFPFAWASGEQHI